MISPFFPQTPGRVFRRDVISALNNYYGSNYIDTSGTKSVAVLPSSGRLKADVVIAGQYHFYTNLRLIAEGIIFWIQPGWGRIINYPKLHYSNGTGKNSIPLTKNLYKPIVRIFMNARNKILEGNSSLVGKFPSYFIECLLYYVPDSTYSGNYQTIYLGILRWLVNEFVADNHSKFTTQNGKDYLFGQLSVQWNEQDAVSFLESMIDLWENW